MRAEVIDKCKYLLTLTLTAGVIDCGSDRSPRHSRSLNSRDENSFFVITSVNVFVLLWRYRSKQRFLSFLVSRSHQVLRGARETLEVRRMFRC